MLPPGVALHLDDAQDAANQTNPEPCTVAGREYGHGQQVRGALNLLAPEFFLIFRTPCI